MNAVPETGSHSQRGDIRVAFLLAGLHRVSRGAEVAFESIAHELGDIPGFAVTLIGSGKERPGRRYRFIHSPCIPREKFERWPRFPPFRSEYAWEEATFAAQLGKRYEPNAYDITVTCSYPFLNWLLRLRKQSARRPQHIFVTQNGDWPVQARNSEYRWFGCDALICTNSVYFDLHKKRGRTWLIPNAVDPARFQEALPDRQGLGLLQSSVVILMVSALVASKRVLEGIRAVAPMDDIHLLVAGDGPLRDQVESEGRKLLGSRFSRITLPFERMPAVYRSANVLLHMSRDEPFGNVYVEALAAGLPVVTHDWASTRWLFENEAVLVDTNDSAAVRTGLRQALGRSSPGDVANRLSLVNRRFTWRAVADAYAECLQATLQ